MWNDITPPLIYPGQITVKNWLNLPITIPKADLYNINAQSKFGEIYCYLLKLSSGNKSLDVSRADNFIKNWQNLPISNPKQDLHNINAYTVLWKSTDIY